MLKKILLAVVAVVVLFLAFAATRPSEFSVVRSLSMSAPPAVAYGHVQDFTKWVAWSPWEKMEPNVKHTYSDPPAGLNATTTWLGEKTGEGAMKITGAKPGEHLDIQLDFIKPFPATNAVTFDFAAEGAGTKVTWAMKGHNNFMSKVFGIFMNMDEMIGKDFEAGLAGIKQVSETEAAALAKKAAEDAAAAEAAAAAAAAAATDAGTPEAGDAGTP